MKAHQGMLTLCHPRETKRKKRLPAAWVYSSKEQLSDPRVYLVFPRLPEVSKRLWTVRFWKKHEWGKDGSQDLYSSGRCSSVSSVLLWSCRDARQSCEVLSVQTEGKQKAVKDAASVSIKQRLWENFKLTLDASWIPQRQGTFQNSIPTSTEASWA